MYHLSSYKRSALATLVSLALFSTASHASVVRSDVDYQYFRDLAENKGAFVAGATNVAVQNKSGKALATMFTDTYMPDLAMVSSNGVATLVSPQYVTSVAHNGGYQTVQFGDSNPNPDNQNYNYLLVDRNNYADNPAAHIPSVTWTDYHAPRLNKLVTEVAAANVPADNNVISVFADRKRYTHYLRVGAGVQRTMDADGTIHELADAYLYKTAGTGLTLHSLNKERLLFSGNPYTSTADGDLASYVQSGDSGSPYFAFNNDTKQWDFIGVIHSISGNISAGNAWVFAIQNRPDYISAIQQQDNAGTITNSLANNQLNWTADGKTSRITGNGVNLAVNLADNTQANSNAANNHGKNFTLSGEKGTLTLASDINQGAGAIYFDSDFTVKGANANTTWLGAGVSVANGKNVQWQVHNPSGDRLSKIGEGTLTVSGTGVNQGSISVGDGTVVLNQQADSSGKRQAFSEVGIVSGRATVVLNSADQVNPNNIYFGFRGGRLDVNGNNLTFERIRSSDDGANLVNHNANQAATVTLTGNQAETLPADFENHIVWGKWKQVGADIYEYKNTWAGNRLDYFFAKAGGRVTAYYPTGANSDANWEYVGSGADGKARAIALLKERKQAELDRQNQARLLTSFNGMLGEADAAKTNGQLNVVFNPTQTASTLLLSGGVNLNGELRAENGVLHISGKPTAHAYDKLNLTEVVREDDWVNRNVNATQIVAKNNALVEIGRNVAEVNANFTAYHNAQFKLGFNQGNDVCRYSDYSGATTCHQAVLSAENFANLPTTQIHGNIKLNDQSQVILGKSTLTGKISGNRNSLVALSPSAHWQNTGRSEIGNLHLNAGSSIDLNANFDQGTSSSFNQLLVHGNLTGVGRFNFLTDVAGQRNDGLTVNGYAQGDFTIGVKNTGSEPNQLTSAPMIRLNYANQANHQANFALENGYVDLGTYRYILAKEGNVYRLYSPLRDAQLNGASPSQSVATALANAQAASAEVAALTAEAQAKQQALNEATATYNSRSESLTIAIAAMQKAEEAFNKRQGLISKMNNYRALNLAKQNVQTATNNFAQAQTSYNAASAAYQTAQQNVQTAQNALTLLEQALANAQAQDVAQAALLSGTNEQRSQAVKNIALARCQAASSDLANCEAAAELVSSTVQAALTAYLNQTAFVEELSKQIAELSAKSNLTAAESEALTLLNQQLAEAELQAVNLLQALGEANPTAVANLDQATWLSRYANTALSDISAQTNAALLLGQSVQQHILSTRTEPLTVWVNQQWNRQNHRSDLYRSYQQDSRLTQFGVEKDLADHNRLRAGLILTDLRTDNQFDQATGENQLFSTNAYVKYTTANGVFTSADLGYTHANNELRVDQSNVEFKRNMTNVGLTLGKTWNLSWVEIQPSIAARLHYLQGSNYQLNGANVQIDPSKVLALHAGLQISKELKVGEMNLRPILTTSYVNTQNNDFNVQVNQYRLQQSIGNRLHHSLGLAAKLKNWEMSTNVGYVHNDESEDQYHGGVQLNYSW